MNTKGYALTIRQYPNLTGYEVATSAAEAKSNRYYRTSDITGHSFKDYLSCRRVPELDGRAPGSYDNFRQDATGGA